MKASELAGFLTDSKKEFGDATVEIDYLGNRFQIVVPNILYERTIKEKYSEDKKTIIPLIAKIVIKVNNPAG